MFWVLLISRCTACFYELLVIQIGLSTLILAWNWLHIKRNVRKRVWRIVLIPFMPPTLKILVKTRLLESQTEVGEPTNYNTSSQALPVFSLGLQQPSSHWIISNRVVSSINIFFLYCQFDFHWITLLCAPDYNSDSVSDPIMSETQP